MATPSGGKFRSKRSHYSRKPYERPKPKSLLARVSDTVKDFITPSWLNNLWNNPNDDDGEGSSRSSTPELPLSDGQPAGGTPNFMPSAVATSTPDINLRIGKEALSVPGPSSMETTPIVQLREDVVRDEGRNVVNDEDDVVIVEEEQPSTSTGVRHTPLPFRNYANPIGTSTPNEDMQLLGGRKQVIDKDDASDTSVSTSGCSSLVPHVDRVDHREKLSKKNLDRLSEMGHSNSLAKSSLWTDMSSAGTAAGAAGLSSSKPQQSISSAKRPAFNSSYFGSPKLVGESRPRHASPFYPGRTQFGGSSAQRSALKRHRDSPYEVHLPVKRNIRPKPAQLNLQDSIGGATSSTAKKILDTLERMSTPLLDAKKIPLSPTASPYSFRPTSRLASRPSTSRTNTPPTSGLHVAHQASIKANRQPPVSTISTVIDLEDERVKGPSSDEVLPTSTAAPTISTAPSFRFGAPITSSTPAVSGFDEGPSGREKTGGKMKSKSRNTMHYSAQKADEEVCEIPDLPEVALPLPKGLPSFSFGTSLTSSTTSLTSRPSSQSSTAAASTKNLSLASSSSSSKVTPTQSSTVPSFQVPTSSAASTLLAASTSSGTSSSEGVQFTFASPIIKQTGSSSTSSSMNSSSTVTTFKFSMPRQTPYSTSRPSASAPLGGKKPSFETPERTRRKGDDDVVEVKDEEQDQGGIKVAKELKTGSCLEAFGIRLTKNGPIPSSSSKVQAHPAKESTTKMDNGPLTGSPSKKTGASNLQNDTSSKQSNSIFNKFKPAASSWECGACMLQNKEDASKCVACETPKPGKSASKPATSAAPVGGQSNSLFNKFKPAANSWECNTCMVQNKGDADKCVACETPKPGQNASNSAVSSISGSKPPPVFNSLGSKFSKQSNEWECDTCMVQNKDSEDKCVACTTPRPGKSKGGETKTLPKEHIANNVIADKFKASAGEWECDTCMIRNKATILKCMACETPKPGSQPALSAPPASSFKFGNTSLSNGDATGAFKFGNSTTSDTLNSNTNASGGGFKLPTGFSLGQSLKPAGTDSNGTLGSTSGGFKLPANFSLSKASSNSSTTKTTAASEVKSSESSLLGQAKSEQKLEVKVPTGMKFGASSSESGTPGGGIKFGTGAPSGALTFGQNDVSSKSDSSSSIGGGFKFGQSPATVGQTLLDKEGPPPNVNIFQSNATEGEGPTAKKSFSFGAAAPTTAGTSEKKTDGATPTFSFGSSSSTKEKTLNADTSAVKFGAGAVTFGSAKATDSSVKPAESKPSFSFGSTASSSANSSAPTSSSTTPSFNFGGSSTSTPDSAKALSTDSKPGFTFGSNVPSQTTGSGLAFGAKAQEPASTSAGTFMFGQSTAAPEKTASAPTFNFGASAAPAAPTTKEEPAKSAAFTFGSQNQNNNQGGSGFSFGAPAAAPAASAAPAQTTPSFNFGTANKTPAASSTGGFNFGATQNSNTQFTGSSATSGFGGFGSNRSSTNPSPAFGAPPAATQPPSTFTFGSTAPTTSANSNPFGGSTPTANATPFGGQATNPTFGSANSQSQVFGASAPTQASVFGSSTNATTNSTFGSGLGASTTGAPAFGAPTNATSGFGNKPAPAFGSGTANATSGGFQFGKSAPTFFGATNNATPAAPSQGAFQFTGNQPNQAPQVAPAATPQPAGGFNFVGAGQPPSFNFGGSTPQAGTTAFQFQASTGAADSNPFSASPAPGTAPPGRKIKRAVRRSIKR